MEDTVWVVTSNDLGQLSIVKIFNNSAQAEAFKERRRASDKFRFYECKSYHVFDHFTNEEDEPMPVKQFKGGTSITGAAQHGFRAVILAGALKLYADTGMRPSWHITLKIMLAHASEITGKRYTNTRKSARIAELDIRSMLTEAGDLDTMGADMLSARQRNLV